MKALILAERYPDNDGSVALMYIHTRNLYYAEHGIDVTVLNFRATTGYRYQGIRVITWKEYAAEKSNYDLLVLHAPNVKNHYRFLTIYGDRFPKFVFFYHGHEVLKINQVYSKPYPFVHVNCIKKSIQEIYDTFKLTVWRRYLPTQAHKSHYVFVSRWMYEEFLKWTRIPKDTIRGKYSITYNCVGKSFENETFDTKSEKQYDFVTIRSNLDVSKYAVDIVNRLAKNTPGRKFLLVGKGDFFSHYDKAPNLEWRNQTMSHQEIIHALQNSRFALMPTRTDAQGLMMCEMAALGIPVITSDIPVCHEVFDGFENAEFIDNDNESLSLETIAAKESCCHKDTRYYMDNTVAKELNLMLCTLDSN